MEPVDGVEEGTGRNLFGFQPWRNFGEISWMLEWTIFVVVPSPQDNPAEQVQGHFNIEQNPIDDYKCIQISQMVGQMGTHGYHDYPTGEQICIDPHCQSWTTMLPVAVARYTSALMESWIERSTCPFGMAWAFAKDQGLPQSMRGPRIPAVSGPMIPQVFNIAQRAIISQLETSKSSNPHFPRGQSSQPSNVSHFLW